MRVFKRSVHEVTDHRADAPNVLESFIGTAYHHMATMHRLVTILILFLAGCEQPPASVSQLSPAATDQTHPSVEPIEPAATPDATSTPGEQVSEITGKVVGIIDGHTIDILTADKTTIRIRLNGIDAPETGQPFSKNAKQFLSEKIGGQVVRVITHGEDRYGRTIGDVYFKSGWNTHMHPGTTSPISKVKLSRSGWRGIIDRR